MKSVTYNKSFLAGEELLKKTITNHKNLQQLCDDMNIMLEDGYFNVISTMCEYVFEFQDKVLKMLVEAIKNKCQDNIKSNTQQKNEITTPPKVQTPPKAKAKPNAKNQPKTKSKTKAKTPTKPQPKNQAKTLNDSSKQVQQLKTKVDCKLDTKIDIIDENINDSSKPVQQLETDINSKLENIIDVSNENTKNIKSKTKIDSKLDTPIDIKPVVHVDSQSDVKIDPEPKTLIAAVPDTKINLQIKTEIKNSCQLNTNKESSSTAIVERKYTAKEQLFMQSWT